MRKIVAFALAGLVCVNMFAGAAEEKADAVSKATPRIKETIKGSVDKGIHYLKGKMAEDGSWSRHPGVTALVLTGFLDSHRKYNQKDGPMIRKPVEYILKHAKDNGSICGDNVASYSTSMSVIALSKLNNSEYDKVIAKACDYLVRIQSGKAGAGKGGFGYDAGSDPDMSNMQVTLEALKASGLTKESPVWKNAVAFINHCQNRSESNDLKWAGNDGGFVYKPQISEKKKEDSTYIKEDGTKGIKSYGSMTFAGVRSLIFCDVDKDDKRVTDAVGWIRANYSVTEHPGMGQQSLYYYYYTFAKAFSALEIETLKTKNGKKRYWRYELAKQICKLQQKDGSWSNKNDRFWESDPSLATAYAINALNLCYK